MIAIRLSEEGCVVLAYVEFSQEFYNQLAALVQGDCENGP